MKRRIPLTSDHRREVWLQHLLDTASLNKQELPQKMLEEARSLKESFSIAMSRKTDILADRNKYVVICDKHLSDLSPGQSHTMRSREV